MAIADASILPVAAHIESASPHEVKFVIESIGSCFNENAPNNPNKLIGDKAYDSNEFDQGLNEDRKVEIIAPHRTGRKKPKTQDGNKLRLYRSR